jgi:hydroxyacylglutathione hydrolase
VGGNKELLDAFPSMQVVGHSSDKGRIPGQSLFVEEGDTVSVGEELSAHILFNPAHTRGAISYVLDDPGCVFTGDTLFTGGCGRLFEGTPEQMLAAMDKYAALPDETRVYCGHEYTAANLRFAQRVEPDNAAISERAARVDALRSEGKDTMGSSIAEERATNPFMRSREAAVIAAAAREEGIESEEPAAVLGAIRRWKDRG